MVTNKWRTMEIELNNLPNSSKTNMRLNICGRNEQIKMATQCMKLQSMQGLKEESNYIRSIGRNEQMTHKKTLSDFSLCILHLLQQQVVNKLINQNYHDSLQQCVIRKLKLWAKSLNKHNYHDQNKQQLSLQGKTVYSFDISKYTTIRLMNCTFWYVAKVTVQHQIIYQKIFVIVNEISYF